jgi:hypothetical protein
LPLKDFKSFKALRFAGSCQELTFLSTVIYDIINSQTLNTSSLEQAVREGYNLFLESNKPDLLIKYSLMVAELYDLLQLPEQAANCYIKIGQQIPKVYHYVAIFFE